MSVGSCLACMARTKVAIGDVVSFPSFKIAKYRGEAIVLKCLAGAVRVVFESEAGVLETKKMELKHLVMVRAGGGLPVAACLLVLCWLR